jgi:hypothetical protein
MVEIWKTFFCMNIISMPKSKEIKNKNTLSMLSIQSLFSYFNNHIQALNSSKLFAGLMIIILNIASKFVNIKVGKTLEAYLKYTFSRQILVFAIAWMGTRDIYIAFLVTICFVIITDYLLHEDSPYFILTPEVRDYHLSKMENMENITDDEIKKAKDILEKAEKQKSMKESNSS